MKAVISGATRGIGKAIAKRLANEGYDLVLLARNKVALTELANQLKSENRTIEALSIDLAEKNFVKKLHQNAAIFINSTVLVNNLGLYGVHSVSELTVENTAAQIQVNLLSAIGLSNFVCKQSLLKNIINIGSVMGLQANKNAASYSISKHAFKGWNDALRESLKTEGTLVSAIYPGAVNTSSWDGIEADRTKMIQAEDVAECAATILKMNRNTLIEEIRISPRDFI